MGPSGPVVFWETVMGDVESKRIFSGRVIDLDVETVSLPNGVITTLEIAHHPGGAAILAEDDQQRICMLRQYRHAVREWIWELPAGKLEPNESPIATAHRELLEETGLTTLKWTSMGSILTTPGFCDEVIHLFHACQLTQAASSRETDEILEMHWRTPLKLEAMISSGELRDAKTVIAVLQLLKRTPG